VAELGLTGGFGTGFPRFTALSSSQGGLSDFGPTNRTLFLQDKPIAVANVTMVRGNHSYKFGGEWKFENFTNRSTGGVSGTYNFSPAQERPSGTAGHRSFGRKRWVSVRQLPDGHRQHLGCKSI
jgi:hypothetical protein